MPSLVGAARAALLALIVAGPPGTAFAEPPVVADAGAAVPGGSESRPANRHRVDACLRMFGWVTGDPVRFQESSADLRDASRPVLDRLAEFAHDCPDTRLRITGHTDGLGPADYNQVLSELRAEVVAEYLAARGIGRDRLTVAGAGATRPVADNGTPAGRERNRRIEFELLWPDRGDCAQSTVSASSPGACAPNNSTSNTSVEFGGMGPRPAAP